MKKFLPHRTAAASRPARLPADAISDLSDDLSFRSSLDNGPTYAGASPLRPPSRGSHGGGGNVGSAGSARVDASSVGSVSDKIKQLERGKLKRILNPRGFKSSSTKASDAASRGSNKSPRKLPLGRSKKNQPTSAEEGASKSSGRGVARAPSWKSDAKASSVDEMEYSSLGDSGGHKPGGGSVTLTASQVHRSDAVGAAAMAVEYGLGDALGNGGPGNGGEEEEFIGDVDGSTVGGEGDQTGDRPRRRMLPAWEREEDYDAVGPGDIVADEKRGKQGASTAREPAPAAASPPTGRAHKSCNDMSDLEALGRTVQAVQAALHLLSITDTYMPTEDGRPSYGVTGVKFHPRGCLWDASLHVPPGDGGDDESGFAFPLRITCFAEEEEEAPIGDDDSDDADDDNGGRTIGDAPRRRRNAPKTYAVELSLPDRRNPFWGDRPDDVALAMGWVRRHVRRAVRRESGFGATAAPTVRIRLPDGETHDAALDALRRSWKGGDGEDGAPRKADDAGPAPGEAATAEVPSPAEAEAHGMPKVVDVHHLPTKGPPPPLARSSNSAFDAREAAAPPPAMPVPNDEAGGPAMAREEKRSARGGRRPATNNAHNDASPPTPKSKESSMHGTSILTAPTESTTKDSYVSNSARDNGARAGAVRHLQRNGRLPDEGGTEKERPAYELEGLTKSQRRMASRGLMSEKTVRRLSGKEEAGKDDSSHGTGEVNVSVPREVIRSMERGIHGSYSSGEIRQAQRGVLSRRSIVRLSSEPAMADEIAAPPEDADRYPEMEGLRHSWHGDRGTSFDDSPVSTKSDTTGGNGGIAKVPKEVIRNMKQGNYSRGEIRQAKRGLVSQNSLRRLSSDEAETETPARKDGAAVDASDRTPSDEDLRKYQMGLMSAKSMRRLVGDEDEDSVETLGSTGQGKGAGAKRGDANPERALGRSISNAMRREHRVEGEVRQARRGLMSKKTFLHLEDVMDRDRLDDDSDDASLDFGEVRDSFSQKQLEQAKMGLLRDKSMSQMGIDQAELLRALAEQQAKETEEMARVGDRPPEGEIRMARMGCLSKKSCENFRKRGIVKSSSRVSFTDDDGRRSDSKMSIDTGATPPGSRTQGAEKKEEATAALSIQKMFRRRRTSETMLPKAALKARAGEDEADKDVLVFSNKQLEKQSDDILTEGQYFLGISMLVYMYSHLRETCRMGHTRVKMEDIDVHSVQSQYQGKTAKKYLHHTKTAGSIIRVVIDELEGAEDDDEEHDIVGDENKEYEKSITAQFHTWIEDSRVNQLDEETEKMIIEMKRKVARHRWKRAISAVRLSYKLSGGKRPKFENPVSAPGCENQNRFVDMNKMMSEAIRTQPKYFREGSVMHNLIESGIELVWFSDLSQHDVVYGICVQRELKKVTVVFRGTVNAHNWKMNLKFDTNEYRNPVKQHYPGRVDELSLHSGFALYLLRKRKDTGISKLQEIFDKIDDIGREMAPDGNYKLSITGHSLGGALATLCGFYVAARSRFAHLSTIYVWTFAAPRVGTQAFMHAWQHLERTGRIRHARFSATHDLVPLVPFCNFERDDLQFYKHVGVRVQLHGVGRIGKWRLRRNLDVTYPLRHDWMSEIRRVMMNNFFANLTTLSGFKRNHNLTEYQKRVHFAMTYRKALGSGVFFSDKRRNRIKSLDEYYHIRAKITSDSIAEEILEQSKQPAEVLHGTRRSHVFYLVFVLLLSWAILLVSVTTDVFERHPLSVETILTPFAMIASGVWHVALLPVSIPVAIYGGVSSRARNALNAVFHPAHVKRTAFVSRRINTPALNSLMSELAARRAKHHMAVHQVALSSSFGESTQHRIFESTATHLFGLAALIDNGANPRLTIAAREDYEPDFDGKEESDEDGADKAGQITAQLQAAEAKLQPLQDYASGVTFSPKLDEGMYLVGVGIRKKSIIKIYAVAMYSSAAVLTAASQPTLRSAARTFDSSTPVTSFVLEMTYSVGAEKIAGAIAESVKPRYAGASSDINALESLIVRGVNAIGGQASKGTVFRFDCSSDGVSVSVNGAAQGLADFAGLGSSFVDVFMDAEAVSPTLVENCHNTWGSAEGKALASTLLELSDATKTEVDPGEETEDNGDDGSAVERAIESRMQPLQDYATSVTFQPKLDDLYLIGCGVRKKSVIKVYAVSMYSSAAVVEALSPFSRDNRKEAANALRASAQAFGPSTPMTSFVLEMVYSAGAEKIASAIAESVKPRYRGSPSDVSVLEALIVEGVNRKGGQASKGTLFRFDCSQGGVWVSVDGVSQGSADFAGMGSAFVDVFTDDKAVSPTLVESCLSTWGGVELS